MKRAWLLGLGAGAAMGLMAVGQVPALAGHGHGGSSHPVKDSHESKGSKPAPHSGPKPQPKHESKPQTKSQPKHDSKPKENNLHKQPSHSTANEHQSNAERPNAISSTTTNNTTHNETTHHDDHHFGHHERFWHGHHLFWSGTAWVDGSGQPFAAADLVPPVEVGGGSVAAPMIGAPLGGAPIQFSVDPSESQAYDRAAQAAGVSRAEWIRSRLNSAVQRELK
jgi:hypothetical protein